MCDNKKYEVKFYQIHNNNQITLLGGQFLSIHELIRGKLDKLAEEYFNYPWVKGSILNVQIKLKKINHLDIDFQDSNNILVEV